MPKTLDDIQSLLTRCGYTCERMVDVIVATTVPTKVYKNPSGENALQIMLTFDHANHCVAVEVLRAFELREAAHKEAALTCLMTAAGRTPLLRPTLEPEGTVGLRIDCTCGRNGAREGDVLQALALLESWVEVWFPQVTTAMEYGKFNAHEVPHLNLLRMGRGSPARSTSQRGRATDAADAAGEPACESSDESGGPSGATAGHGTGNKPAAPTGGTAGAEHGSDGKPEGGAGGDDEDGAEGDDERGPSIGSVKRAAAISEKAGAHPNRLRVLFEFFRRLDEERRGQADQN